MRHARFVPLALALATLTVGVPAANAAPGNCAAVQPARPHCSVQSAGGAFEIFCVVSTLYCVGSVDGATYRIDSGWVLFGIVPYGTVLGVTVHGTAGVATITTSN